MRIYICIVTANSVVHIVCATSLYVYVIEQIMSVLAVRNLSQ